MNMFNTPQLKAAFEKVAQRESYPEGTVLIEPGQYIKAMPIIIKGCIRVLRQDENGNETFLYHIMPGETCALSLTCCSVKKPSEVKTITEEETEMWMLPVQVMEDWQQYKEWKDFIALTYQSRFERLLKAIDEIAFQNMDQRLWKYLLARSNAKENTQLIISHEEIAKELNIQRESATRLIRKLKDLGYIETGRNIIRILKKAELLEG